MSLGWCLTKLNHGLTLLKDNPAFSVLAAPVGFYTGPIPYTLLLVPLQLLW